MQATPQVPHGSWVDVLPYVIVWLIGVSTRWIPLWQNRKKPDAEIHETYARASKTEAETRKIDAEAGKSFGEVIVALSDKITESHDEIEKQRERHAKQVEFLQNQIEIKTDSEQVARIRAHNAIAEVQRCVMAIRDYEEKMRNCDPVIQFKPFDFKSYEEIMDKGE